MWTILLSYYYFVYWRFCYLNLMHGNGGWMLWKILQALKMLIVEDCPSILFRFRVDCK